MEQGLTLMMGSDPRPIGIGDLVVDPGERASRSPFDKGTGLPVQSVPLVLVIDLGRLRPDHQGQLRQTYAGRDALVRVRHPCRCPDHLARECRQPGAVLGIDPGQKRIRVGTMQFRASLIGRIRLGHLPKRDEWPVDIEKQQCTLHGTGHGSTIAVDSTGDRLDDPGPTRLLLSRVNIRRLQDPQLLLETGDKRCC